VRKGPRVANSIYAGTSALILAPMLWELTLRFTVLSPAVAAAVVCAFALAGFALTWESDRKAIVRIVAFAAVSLTLALALAGHTLLPFVVVLLLLTAICEFVPGCDRLPDVAALFALAADALIWMTIYIYFAGPAAREDFPSLIRGALLAPGIAIFFSLRGEHCRQDAYSRAPNHGVRDDSNRPCLSTGCGQSGGLRAALRGHNSRHCLPGSLGHLLCGGIHCFRARIGTA